MWHHSGSSGGGRKRYMAYVYSSAEEGTEPCTCHTDRLTRNAVRRSCCPGPKNRESQAVNTAFSL